MITTSGAPLTAHDETRHFYIGSYKCITAKAIAVSDDTFAVSYKGDSHEYSGGRTLKANQFPTLTGSGYAGCYFIYDGSGYVPCNEDHTGW